MLAKARRYKGLTSDDLLISECTADEEEVLRFNLTGIDFQAALHRGKIVITAGTDYVDLGGCSLKGLMADFVDAYCAPDGFPGGPGDSGKRELLRGAEELEAHARTLRERAVRKRK